jgi:predicted alpha/beta superfamily hydrolase
MSILRTVVTAFVVSLAFAGWAAAGSALASPAAPLSIGDTWTIASTALGETRRINVYVPAGIPAGTPLPVLVMPDGGMLEDFLHVAGLLQVGAGNGTVRPFLLVGIENTQRRRDLTGPTEIAKDRGIAPRVGGSQAYRTFIRTELMPEVERRYRVTQERAIVGESLAGLFVVETLALEPDLFDTYIAIDPSLWWNGGQLAKRLSAHPPAAGRKTLYVAVSADGLPDVDAALKTSLGMAPGLGFTYEAWPGETHATVYHPAALKAFRAVLKPR